MGLKFYQIIVPVTDIEEARNFYSRLLETPGRRGSPGRYHFDCSGVVLTCWDSDAEGSSAFPLTGSSPMYFAVSNPDETLERARSAEANLLDEKIVAQPWGGRFFRLKDPFGNLIVFVDEDTVQRQLEEQSTAGPKERLRTGTALTIQSPDPQPAKRFVASVTKIFKKEVWLKIAEPPAQPEFEKGEKVRIQYWADGLPYYSDTQVATIPADPRYLAVAIPKESSLLQRRTAPRVSLRLPLSFSVLTSAESELASGEALQSETQDLSVGGLRFDSSLPLLPGDRLQVDLTLPTSEKVIAPVKVISSDPIERDGRSVTWIGAQFVELKLDDQIKILQFMIDTQEQQPAET